MKLECAFSAMPSISIYLDMALKSEKIEEKRQKIYVSVQNEMCRLQNWGRGEFLLCEPN